MSYLNGMAALNLEMPDIIPRTEYSAHNHWSLAKSVTGIDVDENSSQDIKSKASSAFIKAWDYGIFWNVYLNTQLYGDFFTRMGHAVYDAGGGDFNNDIYCPFDDVEDVYSFDPVQKYGAIDKTALKKNFTDNYNYLQNEYTDTVNMTGIYTTCMSGLIEILGWDMLLTAAGYEPDKFGSFTDRYADWLLPAFEALADTDTPVVMIHDDIVWTDGAFISKEWYRKYIFPNYKKLFAPLIEKNKKILYTSDGTYTEFVDDIAACNVNGFVLEPTTDMKYIAEKYGETHVIIGNADTRILLYGSKDEIQSEVKRCMDIGRSCPGFIIAVGNHIPANTPVDNALYYNDFYMKVRNR